MIHWLLEWWTNRRWRRAERRHAYWCANAIALIAERDPALAARTYDRILAMNDALDTAPKWLAQEFAATRIAQVDVVMAALESVE